MRRTDRAVWFGRSGRPTGRVGRLSCAKATTYIFGGSSAPAGRCHRGPVPAGPLHGDGREPAGWARAGEGPPPGGAGLRGGGGGVRRDVLARWIPRGASERAHQIVAGAVPVPSFVRLSDQGPKL